MRLALLALGLDSEFVVPRLGEANAKLRKVTRKLHKEGLLLMVSESGKEFVYETTGKGRAYITHHKLIKALRESI